MVGTALTRCAWVYRQGPKPALQGQAPCSGDVQHYVPRPPFSSSDIHAGMNLKGNGNKSCTTLRASQPWWRIRYCITVSKAGGEEARSPGEENGAWRSRLYWRAGAEESEGSTKRENTGTEGRHVGKRD